jgi:CubicO group peptidase (beta-lactamase class C family)
LRDRVSDYLADWPSAWDAVTVQDLLSHSAGTDIDTTYFWLVKHHPEYWPESSENPPPYEPRPLLTEPGTTFLYSNVGYTLLTRIASAAGGEPFDELMRDEVFCPLGLTDTQPERGVMVAGRARGHRKTAGGIELSEQRTIDIVGAGDLVSTADDLARFDEALDDDRFLPAELRAAMFSPHPPQKNWYGSWGEFLRTSEIGYGWFLRTTEDGQPMQFHTGSGAGFRAFNVRLPRSGIVIVVLSNLASDGPAWVPDLVERVNKVLSPESPLDCGGKAAALESGGKAAALQIET